MRLPQLNFSSTQVVSYCLLALSALLLLACVYMTYSIDVVTDWKLSLPEKKIHVGDTVVVASTYKKLRDVTGEASRFLDCNTKQGVSIRYPVNKASASRGASDHRQTGTGIVLVIPNTIPDLPTKCRIAVSIDYPVLPWRHVIENNETKDFTLYPAVKSSVKPVSGGSQRTSQTQGLNPSSVSSTKNTPSVKKMPSNTSQKPASTSSPSKITSPPKTQTVCDSIVLPLLGTLYEWNCREEPLS
jgi:hypothetical protein